MDIDTGKLEDADHFRGLDGERLEIEQPPKESEQEILFNLKCEAIQEAEYLYKKLRYREGSRGEKRSGLDSVEIFDWLKKQKLLEDGKPNHQALLLYLLWASVKDEKVFVYLTNLFAGQNIEFPSHEELDKVRRNILISEWKKLSYEETRILSEDDDSFSDILNKTPKEKVVGIKDNKAIIEKEVREIQDGKEITVTKREEIPLDTEGLWKQTIIPAYTKLGKTRELKKQLSNGELSKITGLSENYIGTLLRGEDKFNEGIEKEEEEFKKLFEGFEDVEVKDIWVDTETGKKVNTEFDHKTGHTTLKETREIIHYGAEEVDGKIQIRKPNLRYMRQQIVKEESKAEFIKGINARKLFRKITGIWNLARQILSLLLYQSEVYFEREKRELIKTQMPSLGQSHLVTEIAKEVAKKSLEDVARREKAHKRIVAEQDFAANLKREAITLAEDQGISFNEALEIVMGGHDLMQDPGSVSLGKTTKEIKKK